MLQLRHTIQNIINWFVKVALPSKSTSPSPFRSTSLRISSTSFRPTWKKRRMAELSSAQHTVIIYTRYLKILFIILRSTSYLLAQQLPHCISELRCAYGTIPISVKLRTKKHRNNIKNNKTKTVEILKRDQQSCKFEPRNSYLSKCIF